MPIYNGRGLKARGIAMPRRARARGGEKRDDGQAPNDAIGADAHLVPIVPVK